MDADIPGHTSLLHELRAIPKAKTSTMITAAFFIMFNLIPVNVTNIKFNYLQKNIG